MLQIALDPAQDAPLHAQLEQGLREGVRAGRLRPGAPLPATRALARQLGVSRGVVVEAYAQLAAEGYLTARHGSGTRVADSARAVEPDRPAQASARPRASFHPGLPDVAGFPREAWLASARRALRAVPDHELGYGSPKGPRVLREALADHLGRVRGVVARPERIVVCSGLVQGVGLVARALRARGVVTIAMEDPGFVGHRMVLEHEGLEVVGVPIDEDGLRVDALARTDAGAVLVTPAHQSPTGAVLAPERRAALLAWAERTGAFVIEDDYDAEHRFDREPVGALQGLAPERVVYAGSASKVLAPALRLGWILAPAELAGAVATEKAYADLGTPIIEQLTLADFLTSGGLDRHLRRSRRTLRGRRDALVGALGRHLPEARLLGVAAGLHVMAVLPDGTDEQAVIRGGLARGVEVHGVAPFRFAPGPPALLFGYAGMPEPAIERAVAEVAAAYREAASG